MKTMNTLLLLAGLATGSMLRAAEPPPGAPADTNPAAPAEAVTAATNAVPAPASGDTSAQAAAATNAVPAPASGDSSAQAAAATNAAPAVTVENGANGLLLNFHGAPLNLVLEYLSDAAGFIINKQVTELRGTVEVWSKKPVSKDEAVELLDSVLRKNGYAVARNNRILTIYSVADGRTSSELPVRTVSKPEEVDSDDAGTWVIPVRFVNATQLMNNLRVLLPLSDELAVNESANSLVIFAPGRDVRRMLKVINALDTSVASVSSIEVFRLKYADAKQLATEVQQLFGQTAGQAGGMGMGGRAQQFFNMIRGGGPFGGGGGGQGGSSGGNPAGTKVAAASDDYSNSLIVNAAPEMMATIKDMVLQIDVPTTDITEVEIFHLQHADPSELADQFALLFPDTSRTDTGTGFGFRFGPGGPFGRNNQTTSNDRSKKKSQVITVPDPRTKSLLVSAASEMMPHIREMVERLDAIDARHEVVAVHDLANADPQDVQNILQDLFQRSGSIRQSSTANRNSMLGTGNPLTQRATQNQLNSSSLTSGFGSSRGGGSSFSGGF
ncbi:MAG: secretin N-terminal domain-containing protein [Verrucomicrobiota bacterium]|jgi:type II secretory pathway component GspD/PulD (secretin)